MVRLVPAIVLATFLFPALAPAQQPTSVANTTWRGVESLPGYGVLVFEFHGDNTVTMTDSDGQSPGNWEQDGRFVTLRFYGGNVIYTGSISGNEMVGSARNGQTTWQWRLRKN
jgi:hypothetical protein